MCMHGNKTGSTAHTWYNIFLLVIAIPGLLFFFWVAIRYRGHDDKEADRYNENVLEDRWHPDS